jgi:hypothetical protein
MPKTRKPYSKRTLKARHTQGRKRRRGGGGGERGTKRAKAGAKGLLRLFTGPEKEVNKQKHNFNEIYEDSQKSVNDLPWLDFSKEYMNKFYLCKKSNKLIQLSRRGACEKKDGIDPSEYWISTNLKTKLIALIIKKITKRIEEETTHDEKNPKMITRIIRYFRNHEDYLIKTAIDDFYVRTQSDKQSLLDKQDPANKNPIPAYNEDSVFVPAKLYLTSTDYGQIKSAVKLILTKETNKNNQSQEKQQTKPVNQPKNEKIFKPVIQPTSYPIQLVNYGQHKREYDTEGDEIYSV